MEGQNLGLHKFSTAVRIRFVEYSRNTYEAYDICVQSDTKRTLLKKILKILKNYTYDYDVVRINYLLRVCMMHIKYEYG